MGRTESDQGVKKPKTRSDVTKLLDKLIDPAFERIIFTLSPRLGGRSEVLETPILEALSYLGMEKKEKEQARIDNFYALFFGANSKVEAKARKAYYEKIKPKEAGKKILGNSKKPMEWDYAKMDEFRVKTK